MRRSSPPPRSRHWWPDCARSARSSLRQLRPTSVQHDIGVQQKGEQGEQAEPARSNHPAAQQSLCDATQLSCRGVRACSQRDSPSSPAERELLQQDSCGLLPCRRLAHQLCRGNIFCELQASAFILSAIHWMYSEAFTVVVRARRLVSDPLAPSCARFFRHGPPDGHPLCLQLGRGCICSRISWSWTHSTSCA